MSASESKPRLGFIGLGKMGAPMARRLIDTGHHVIVHDIAAGAVRELQEAGARAARSPREVAAEASIVFTCLPSLDAVREVVTGPNGLTHGNAFQILVDHSTTGPEFAETLGKELAQRRVHMLDAPISGGVQRAREGKLSVIVSGEQLAFDRACGLLEALGKVHYMGSKSGQAQMMKLVNNLLSQIATAATYEAFVLGAKAGLDPDAMVEVINSSTGANNCTLHKMPRSVLPRTFDYGSNMEITYKDISLCMKEAERLGVTMFLGNMARQLWGYGVNHGGAKRDSSTLITHFEEWAGVQVIGKAARERK
ncbi:MAG: NAD(P)-dependent oxidoreductase [Betaproteobacteria bacterium]|nr:MAG: NAD(P)-dependent oxidoreductase [Betaproteobacteria bacterium]